MLIYDNGKFCVHGFAFEVPNGYAINTEPMECLPDGFGAWAAGGEEIYIEWEIETGCNGTYNELAALFIPGSGMFPITGINPIIINGLPGHHVVYSYKGGQRYEIRLSSGEGRELSFRVSSEDVDILTAVNVPSVQTAIKGIWPWKPKEKTPDE